MNLILLRIHYGILFFLLFSQSFRIFNANLPVIDYVMFARFLNMFNPSFWIQCIIWFLSLFFCLVCLLRPNKYFQILATCFFLLSISIYISCLGKGEHLYYAWMISSFCLCFFSLQKPLNSKRNYTVLRLIQGLLLSHYFLSGVWKLYSMIQAKFKVSFKDIVIEYIAFTLARGRELHPILEIFLYQTPELLSIGFFCVLLFQLSSLIPVIFDRFFILYGVFALLFHFSVGLLLGIYFNPTVLAALFFLIICEFMIKNENITLNVQTNSAVSGKSR